MRRTTPRERVSPGLTRCERGGRGRRTGRGEGDGHASTALSADGRTALVYLPRARAVEVSLDAVGGDRVAVSWLDPAAGAEREGDVLDGGGTVEVRPPDGSDDAVLVLRER